MRMTRANPLSLLSMSLLLVGCSSSVAALKGPDGAVEVRPADIQRWLDAWNSHDLGKISDLFTPDAVIHQPRNPEPLTTATMKPFFESVFKTFPDIHFESAGVTLGRSEAVSWELVTGTMLGPMTEPASGKTFPPTGRRFSQLAGKRIAYAPDGRIREFWSIWDQSYVLTQIGLPGDAGTAPPAGDAGTASPAAEASAGATAADVTRWTDAWNSHDIEKVVALFGPDAVVDQPSNPKPLDAAGIRSFFAMIFVAYPDFHISIDAQLIDGWQVVTIERDTGHWLGPYTNPATGKTTKPNGRAFDHPGAITSSTGPTTRSNGSVSSGIRTPSRSSSGSRTELSRWLSARSGVAVAARSSSRSPGSATLRLRLRPAHGMRLPTRLGFCAAAGATDRRRSGRLDQRRRQR
jgi:ketosteroid isomerase-like protein